MTERLIKVIKQTEARGSNPSQNFVQGELDRVSLFLNKKTRSRESDFAQNPDWPGLFFRKTARMKDVETTFSKPWEDLTGFLHNRYWDQSKTAKEIGEELGISSTTLAKWLKILGIGLKPTRQIASDTLTAIWNNSREERIKSLSDAWNKDPVIKAARVAQIHNPVANAKRAENYAQWRKQHPERLSNKEAINALIENKLGQHPEKRLGDLLMTQQLTYREVSERLGVSIPTITSWANKMQIFGEAKEGRKKYGRYRVRRERMELVEQNRALVQELPEQLQKILLLLYPGNGQALTLEEAGQKVNLCRERVRQLEKKALFKLGRLADSGPGSS